jgi:hypothetical protein
MDAVKSKIDIIYKKLTLDMYVRDYVETSSIETKQELYSKIEKLLIELNGNI